MNSDVLKEIKEDKFHIGLEALDIIEKPVFAELLKRIDARISSLTTTALDAESFEELKGYRGEIRGLRYLRQTLDVFVEKAKSAKRSL